MDITKKLPFTFNKKIPNALAEEKKKAKLDEKKAKREKALKEAKDREKIAWLVSEWIKIMSHLGFDNKLDETFSLRHIEVKSYGFKCTVEAASSLTYATLEEEKTINIIQDNLKCLFIGKRGKRGKFEVQFITEDIEEIDFEPMPVKPYELYLGTSIDGEPVVVSMLKYPHILIQGATNMGKTKMIDCFLTNLITQCSPEDLSLYFIQVDKGDQVAYRKCKHTRSYANDIYKALAITNYLVELVNYRNKVLIPYIEDGICGDIYEFNKIRKKHKQNKFSYIYLTIDEYSSLMPNDSSNKELKAIKNAIQDNLERLIQIGRFCGVYLAIGLQRATIDKLPSFIKAMCNTTSTFRVNNEKSSYVAIDSNDAVNLSPREAIVKTNERVMLKTVTLTPANIVAHIKPFRFKDSEYKDFPYQSYMKLDTILEKVQGKKKRPTKQERKEQNKKDSNNSNSNTTQLVQNTKTKLSEEELKKISKNEEKVIKKIENTPKINENQVKVVGNTKNKQEEVKNSNKISPYYQKNWVEPKPKIIIDQTKIDFSKTEKPRKRGTKIDDNK